MTTPNEDLDLIEVDETEDPDFAPSNRKCTGCGKPIPLGRVRTINATTCIDCKDERSATRGIMVFSHKTAPELVVVSSEKFKEINRLDRRGYKSSDRS